MPGQTMPQSLRLPIGALPGEYLRCAFFGHAGSTKALLGPAGHARSNVHHTRKHAWWHGDSSAPTTAILPATDLLHGPQTCSGSGLTRDHAVPRPHSHSQYSDQYADTFSRLFPRMRWPELASVEHSASLYIPPAYEHEQTVRQRACRPARFLELTLSSLALA